MSKRTGPDRTAWLQFGEFNRLTCQAMSADLKAALPKRAALGPGR